MTLPAAPFPVMPTATTVRVRVLLFSVLREAVGEGELSVEVEAPASGARLLDALAGRYPAVARYRPVVRLAVNERYAPDDVTLGAGDEVALITPVSGG